MTFLASSLLAGLDLYLLALATKKLGQKPGMALSAMLGLAVALKLAILVVGALWISRQPWFHRPALIAGLMAPFALFVLWQGLSLQLKKR